MDKISILKNNDVNYFNLKRAIYDFFKNKEENNLNFENNYSLFILKNSFMSILITNTLNSNDGEKLKDLVLFIDDLSQEGIETYITYNQETKYFEMIFSKYIGIDNEKLFNNDLTIFKDNNIEVISLTERFLSCYYNNKFYIKDIQKIDICSFLNKNNPEFIPEYYKDYIN